ncbi:hypothetical protein vseg_013816 [Gypsophila vaccaria]
MMKNSGLTAEENSDTNIESGEMNCDVVNDKCIDKSVDEAANVVGEQAEDMRRKSRIPSKVATDVVGLSKRNTNALVVGGPALKATVRSRYRCPSTGSCHDVCKYGHRIELKKEMKKPLLGTIKESRPLVRTASGDNKLVKSVPVKEVVKDKDLNERLSHPSSLLEKNRPPKTEGVNSSEGVAPSPPKPKIKRVQNEMKPPAVLTSGGSMSRSKIDVPAARKTTQVKGSRKVRETKMKEARSSNESGNGKAKETMSNSPRTLLKKSPSIKATLLKNFRSFSRSRRLSISEDTRLDTKVHVVEADEESSSSQRESHDSTAKKSDGSKKGSRFSLPLFSSSSASKSDASAALPTSRTQGDNQQNTETIDMKQKRSGASHQEGSTGSVWKVKFRRGTVVNLPVASSSPKKLRFRRGRVLGQDQNGKTEARRSLKKIVDMANESPDTKAELEKILLRHQEATVKKDTIDLNNVINETASKLVKTKKSRVKALVGAFESVMSFRDRKHLVATSAS